MEITEVRIFLARNEDEKFKGFASVVFDNCFAVTGLRIISGSNGLFVSYPSRKLQDGTHKDIVHPINNETRKMIEDKVIGEYEVKLKQGPEENAENSSFTL